MTCSHLKQYLCLHFATVWGPGWFDQESSSVGGGVWRNEIASCSEPLDQGQCCYRLYRPDDLPGQNQACLKFEVEEKGKVLN